MDKLPTLDRDKPFGTICGKVANNAKFTQFGLDFDADGKCLTKGPKDVTAANKLIEAAHAPTETVAPEPEVALDVQATHFVHSGAGKYDVFGTDGSVLADNITLEEAEKMVPSQIDGENLAFKQRSDLIARVNKLGGKVRRNDTSDTLIKKIRELLKK